MIKVTLITNNPRKTILASENETVKEILEKNDVNYGNAATAVDGATLSAGEINMTLRDLGIEEKAIISVLAHKDNAAKATIAGSACVVTSKLKPEDIKRFKKFHPELLVMTDEDGEPQFAIDIDDDTPGSLNNYGAVFGSATNSEGNATITIVIDPATEDVTELVYEKLGRAIMKLNELEKKLIEALPDLDAEECAIRANIVHI